MNYATRERTLENVQRMKDLLPDEDWHHGITGLAVALDWEGHPEQEAILKEACVILGVSDADLQEAVRITRESVQIVRSMQKGGESNSPSEECSEPNDRPQGRNGQEDQGGNRGEERQEELCQEG